MIHTHSDLPHSGGLATTVSLLNIKNEKRNSVKHHGVAGTGMMTVLNIDGYNAKHYQNLTIKDTLEEKPDQS